jgi:predicted aminopeptidase
MEKLNYVFPAIVGVISFGAMMQQTNIWTACLCIFISVGCISIAVYERSKK